MKRNLNQNDVFVAIDQYVEIYQEPPTFDSLLKFMGRGSMGTVHKYLSQWRLLKSEQLNSAQSQGKSLQTLTSDDKLKMLPKSVGELWVSETQKFRAGVFLELDLAKKIKEEEIAAKDLLIAEKDALLAEAWARLDMLSEEISDRKEKEEMKELTLKDISDNQSIVMVV